MSRAELIRTKNKPGITARADQEQKQTWYYHALSIKRVHETPQ
jgi:hypothetical protein